jgi:uncharacterized membrane protein YvbJ
MKIPFECPSCGVTYQADERLAGKKGRCKYCGYTVKVPSKEKVVEYKTTKEILRKHTQISRVIKIILIVLVCFMIFVIGVSFGFFNNP